MTLLVRCFLLDMLSKVADPGFWFGATVPQQLCACAGNMVAAFGGEWSSVSPAAPAAPAR